MLKNKFGYAKESKVLGAIAEISFLTGTATIMDESENLHTVSIEEIVELQEIGKLGKVEIYQYDVIQVKQTQKLYEVDLNEDGLIVLHLLNKKLERISTGEAFDKVALSQLAEIAELVGNALEMRDNRTVVDFNLKVFRNINDGEVTYYYVGNNKSEETVDLIKVIFLGHNLIEEEYERITLSYEDFLEEVEEGILKEVDPFQLANYVAGLAYGQKPSVAVSIEAESCDGLCDECDCGLMDEDDEMDEDFCDECGELEEDCNCELWSK